MSIPDSFWPDLLEKLDGGRVIPVIGPSLSVVTIDGETAPLEKHLARRLARELKLEGAEDLTEETSLGEVVACAHRKGIERDYHILVNKLLRQLNGHVKPSTELLGLARIAKFRLFLSLTFDDLLPRALVEERDLERVEDCHLAYAPNQRTDLPAAQDKLREPLVYSLLGKSVAASEFVISEEDLVEWMVALHHPDNRPKLLFDALRGSHLLFIGCRLQDWLARLLIRMTRSERFFAYRPSKETLVGLNGGEDEKRLVGFLSCFSPKTQFLDVTPRDFVAELAKRWESRQTAGEGGDAGRSSKTHELRSGGVFISYSSSDAEAAHRLNNALVARDIHTWLDDKGLAAGDLYDGLIARNIGACGLFLVVLSAALLRRLQDWRDKDGFRPDKRPYFLKEWDVALNLSKAKAGPLRVVPLRIDALDLGDDLIPSELRQMTCKYAPGGEAAPELLDEIKSAVREARRQRRGVA
jgi:hypothetical protein